MPRQYSTGKRPFKPYNNSKPNFTNKPWNKPYNAAPITPSQVFRKGGMKGDVPAGSVSNDVQSYFDDYQKQDALFDWFNKKEIDYMQRVYNYRNKPSRNIFQKIHRGIEKTSFGMYQWLRKNVLGNSTNDLVNNVSKYGIDAAKMFFDIYATGGIGAAEAGMNLLNDAATRFGPEMLQKYGITSVSGKDITQMMLGLERMYSDNNMKIDSTSNGKPVVVPKTPVQINNTVPKGPINKPVLPSTDNRLNIEQNISNPNNKDPDAPLIDLSTIDSSAIDLSKFPATS